jgi:hypothetical protein
MTDNTKVHLFPCLPCRQFMLGGSSSNMHQQQQQQSEESLLDVKHIAQLLARFACNNHTVCDEELRAIGVGLYPLGALINHSCTPNCVQSFQGPAIVFRWANPHRARWRSGLSRGSCSCKTDGGLSLMPAGEVGAAAALLAAALPKISTIVLADIPSVFVTLRCSKT